MPVMYVQTLIQRLQVALVKDGMMITLPGLDNTCRTAQPLLLGGLLHNFAQRGKYIYTVLLALQSMQNGAQSPLTRHELGLMEEKNCKL